MDWVLTIYVAWGKSLGFLGLSLLLYREGTIIVAPSKNGGDGSEKSSR